MKSPGKRKPLGLLLLFSVTAAIFVILYRRFITGSAVYLYTDIGSDSFTSSFPILVYLRDLFHRADFSAYHLNAGLGADTSQLFLKYLNPLKFPLLLFSKDKLPGGLMLARFLETAAAAGFSFGFFRRLTKDDASSVIAALAFSFSGYLTLWSQNLTIGSCMAVFACCMYLLVRALEKKTACSFLLLSAGLALSVLTNYYFTWMTGLFIILFLLVRAAVMKETAGGLFRDAGRTFLAACGALILAAFGVVQIISGMTSSVRTSDLTAHVPLTKMQSPKTMLSLAGRFFSVNACGVGSSYTGGANYYEIAALSSSILVLFALIYLLLEKKTRLITALCLAAGICMLTFRKAGWLLQFNGDIQRFSFLLTFALTAALAVFLREVFTRPDRRFLTASSVTAVLLTAAVPLLLSKAGAPFGIAVFTRAFKEALLFSVLYAAVFLAVPLISRKKSLLAACLLLLLGAELVLMNHDTLYSRVYVTGEGYPDAADDYGIGTAVSSVMTEDTPLCRISATSDSELANAGMLLGFPAASVYQNANPASMGAWTQTASVCGQSQNHAVISWYHYLPLALLSGRYCVVPGDALAIHSLPDALFERKASESGTQAVWELRDALPFGYLYTEETDEASLLSLSAPERLAAMTRACAVTGKSTRESVSGTAPASSFVPPSLVKTDLMPLASEPSDLSVTQEDGALSLKKTGRDPYFFLSFGQGKASSARMLSFRCKGLKNRREAFVLYLLTENSGPDPADSIAVYVNDACPDACVLLPDGVTGIRFDPPKGASSTVLTELSLSQWTNPAEALSALGSADVRDIRFERGTYEASVSSDGGIFCVPVFYSGSWRAEVNGAEVPVEEINGGLCGIRIPSGDVRLSMTWKRPGSLPGLAVSLLSVCAWIALMLFFGKRRSPVSP